MGSDCQLYNIQEFALSNNIEVSIGNTEHKSGVESGGYSMGFVKPAKKHTWRETKVILKKGSRYVYLLVTQPNKDKSTIRIEKTSFPRAFKHSKRKYLFEQIEDLVKYLNDNNWLKVELPNK